MHLMPFRLNQKLNPQLVNLFLGYFAKDIFFYPLHHVNNSFLVHTDGFKKQVL